MPTRALPNRHYTAQLSPSLAHTTTTQNCTVLYRTARCRTMTSQYQSPAHKTTPVHCDTLPYLTGPYQNSPIRHCSPPGPNNTDPDRNKHHQDDEETAHQHTSPLPGPYETPPNNAIPTHYYS